MEVSEANCRQSGDDPIEGDDVDFPCFGVLDLNLTATFTVIQPAAFRGFANIYPYATQDVNGRKEIN